MESSKLAHHYIGVSDVIQGEGGFHHHDDSVARKAFSDFTVFVFDRHAIFRVDIEESTMVSVGLDLVDAGLVNRLIMIIIYRTSWFL